LNIPIKNIYYLLSYAWNKLEEGSKMNLQEDDYSTSLNLFARVFDNILTIIIKRGLDRNYIAVKDKIRTIKGRIDFNSTIKTLSHLNKKYYCDFDNFSEDILTNQIIKATLRTLLNSDINSELKTHLKKKRLSFSSIKFIELNNTHFRKVTIDRNNAYYQFMILICKMIHENSVLDEGSGNRIFREFTGTDKQYAALFEAFVLNFYKRHVSKKYKVKGSEIINWDMEEKDPYFPLMRTDITLENRKTKKKTIIDTKFKENIFAYNYDNPKFHSSNLYQMYAYVKNFNVEKNSDVEGMLLYPTTHTEISTEKYIGGHKFKLQTINLNQDWSLIEKDLLSIVE